MTARMRGINRSRIGKEEVSDYLGKVDILKLGGWIRFILKYS